MVAGGRGSSGLFHGEVAQARGVEELGTPRSGGRQERRQGVRGKEGRGGSRTGTVVDECINEMLRRVARYRFDY